MKEPCIYVLYEDFMQRCEHGPESVRHLSPENKPENWFYDSVVNGVIIFINYTFK